RIRQPRSGEGRGQHPGRRGHALGGSAACVGRRAGSCGLHVMNASCGFATAWPAMLAATLAVASMAVAVDAPAGVGDARRGEEIYGRCLACHALAYNRTGPRHCGLLGRRAGSVPGYSYSQAMKQSGIIWNEQTLDVFLKNPMAAVPGTS